MSVQKNTVSLERADQFEFVSTKCHFMTARKLDHEWRSC